MTAFASVNEVFAVSAGEGEEARLRIVQPYPELRLKQSLFLTEQLLAHEAERERFLLLVVVDHRRHVAETLPASEDCPYAGSSLLAQPDSTERGGDGGVANFLRGRFQQLGGRGECVARIGEDGSVTEEADRSPPAMIAIVLMEKTECPACSRRNHTLTGRRIGSDRHARCTPDSLEIARVTVPA